MNIFNRALRQPYSVLSILLLCLRSARGNPVGGSVAQGSASFNTSGSQLTINTSDRSFINWQSFNIGAGETTTFVQPSSTSLVWNRINDANPSQILGNLEANGYVVLQNQSGFYIGGAAVINTHGLILTTAPIPMPNLSGGGAWDFNTPPPTAQIINYGQINMAGGAPAYLIAGDIQNNGVISAPGGKIGLYAGQKVLVSTSPDGHGLSAEATLPQGSVDNHGKLIADGGSILLQAQVVNQGGLIQANTVKNVGGTIELLASDNLNLAATSLISAHGEQGVASAGGSVTIKSDAGFSDAAGSTVNVSGSAQGGNGGHVEISAAQINNLQTIVQGHAANGFIGGWLLIDPTDITLDSSTVSSLNSQISGGLSVVDLQADDTIELSTTWTLADKDAAASLTLTAGNNIIFDSGSSIRAGKNWDVILNAGAALAPGDIPDAGNDGIYLFGSSFIQSLNGNITLNAANEVQVGWSGQYAGVGNANTGTGHITTIGGGNINVTAGIGDVNSGSSTAGLNFLKVAPYYTPFSVNPFTGKIATTSSLGGISTAAGGNVKITAGGDVVSYFPNSSSGTTVATADPGTGAFGGGDVTINAGGNVYGHYVLINGTGSINAGQGIGSDSQNVSLSLATGGWTLNAGWNAGANSVNEGVGDIYLQEVRNPNGIFNNQGGTSSASYHLFDYDALSFVDLTAGNGVFLTGQNIPRPNDAVPILLPPTLEISAGAGGINLDSTMTLYPSLDGNLHLTTRPGTAGDFTAFNSSALIMSDSAQTHWFTSDSGVQPFSPTDHGGVLDGTDLATVHIDGDMQDVILQTTKKTEIVVGGDMNNSSFTGQNLNAADVTSITVSGQIFNEGSFNWVFLSTAIQNVPLANLPPNTANNWETILSLAVDPDKVSSLVIPNSADPSQYASFVNQVLLFGNALQSGFAYNPDSKKLTVVGAMTSTVESALDQPLTVLRYDANGRPVVAKDSNGDLHFVTDKITWVAATSTDDPIQDLFMASQNAPSIDNSGGGLVVGGTGEFDVHAGSISLGNSYGILTLGNGALLGRDYTSLSSQIQSGANVSVTVDGDLDMPSSTIAALGGGKVTVNSLAGAMDLGSQELVDFEGEIMKSDNLGLGIYSSGGGDVRVTAQHDINVDSSRIGTLNGGNVFVESFAGTVNAGSGGRISIPINVFSPLYLNPNTPFEYVYANGIVALTLVNPLQVPNSATKPGDITVLAPQGDILASEGGILQEALNGSVAAGPVVTLEAGTPASGSLPGFTGNIDLGDSGVIGGTVNLKANGDITGLVISRQNSSVDAAQNFSGTVLSGGSANLAAGGSVSGTVIGIGGVSATGGGTVSATLLGQNVSVNGGAAQSTLGTSATATTTSQSAAQQADSEATQQVAANESEDDDAKKKKAKPLLQRTGRVRVILPKAS